VSVCHNAFDSLHKKLNHPCIEKIRKYVIIKKLDILIREKHNCEDCKTSKHIRTPFHSEPRVEGVLSVVLSDLAGPMVVRAVNKARYIQLTLDKYSNFAIVHLLQTKMTDTVATNVMNAIEKLERESGKKTIKLLTDKGGGGNIPPISLKKSLSQRGLNR
jgi:hypothetical protein